MASQLSRLLLVCAWAVALLLLAAFALRFSGPASQFFGIADDREQTIRFAEPVDIERYGFSSEHEVRKGDVILTVKQPSLEASLEIVREQIRELKFDKEDTSASMRAEVVALQAELEADQSELNAQLRTLRSRQLANQTLIDNLAGAKQTGRDPIASEIASLRIRLRASREATQARVDDLLQKLSSVERPIDARIAELSARERELERQRELLVVKSQLDGRVGSILFKIGETVPPFQPILTVHGTRPTFVKGYIHESVSNDVVLQQRVWIRSMTQDGNAVYPGTVESLGTRIVEFPPRLLVTPIAKAWGREVVVTLEPDHGLLLGEKVSIHLSEHRSILSPLSAITDWLSQ